ncbi:MAG: hypothetical protein CM15mP59_2000 [Flavobacteriaceae bacterium]|nr:MAG: hypothetical protein CM15mP59_2000 [Flavobacteriaceae bacterium]
MRLTSTYTQQPTQPRSNGDQFFLAKMVEGSNALFMEVSSHGIDQHRIGGLQFKGGVFTNLTHDHLDYHKTFESYRIPKRSFLIFFQKLLLHSQTMMIKMEHTCYKIVLPRNIHLP